MLTRSGILGGARGPTLVPLQVIATGGQAMHDSGLGGTPTNYTLDDARHIARVGPQNATAVRLLYSDWHLDVNESLFEVSNPANQTVDGAVETGGVTYPQLFAGASTKLIVPGSGNVLGDAIASMTLTAGSDIFQRASSLVASGSKWPRGRLRNTSIGMDNVTSTNASSQTGATGALSTTGGVSVGTGWAPICIVGLPTHRTPAVCIMGDSIPDALAYDASTGDGHGNWGSFARGCYAAGVPFVKLTQGSMRLETFDPDNSPRLWTIVPYCTHLILHAGTNNLLQASSGVNTVASMQTTYQKIWAKARSLGLKVHQSKHNPRTTSTSGNWTSAVDQTPLSRFVFGGDRDILNT